MNRNLNLSPHEGKERSDVAAESVSCLVFLSGLKLTHLVLPGRHTVTDGGLSALSRLSLLAELDLTDYTQVTDQGVHQLSIMNRSMSASSWFWIKTRRISKMCCVQVEEAVAQQHSGDGRRAALAARPAGAAGAVFGPDHGDQPGRGGAHHLSAAPSGDQSASFLQSFFHKCGKIGLQVFCF